MKTKQVNTIKIPSSLALKTTSNCDQIVNKTPYQ
jgi:hypothetical protein